MRTSKNNKLELIAELFTKTITLGDQSSKNVNSKDLYDEWRSRIEKVTIGRVKKKKFLEIIKDAYQKKIEDYNYDDWTKAAHLFIGESNNNLRAYIVCYAYAALLAASQGQHNNVARAFTEIGRMFGLDKKQFKNHDLGKAHEYFDSALRLSDDDKIRADILRIKYGDEYVKKQEDSLSLSSSVSTSASSLSSASSGASSVSRNSTSEGYEEPRSSDESKSEVPFTQDSSNPAPLKKEKRYYLMSKLPENLTEHQKHKHILVIKNEDGSYKMYYIASGSQEYNVDKPIVIDETLKDQAVNNLIRRLDTENPLNKPLNQELTELLEKFKESYLNYTRMLQEFDGIYKAENALRGEIEKCNEIIKRTLPTCDENLQSILIKMQSAFQEYHKVVEQNEKVLDDLKKAARTENFDELEKHCGTFLNHLKNEFLPISIKIKKFQEEVLNQEKHKGLRQFLNSSLRSDAQKKERYEKVNQSVGDYLNLSVRRLPQYKLHFSEILKHATKVKNSGSYKSDKVAETLKFIEQTLNSVKFELDLFNVPFYDKWTNRLKIKVKGNIYALGDEDETDMNDKEENGLIPLYRMKDALGALDRSKLSVNINRSSSEHNRGTKKITIFEGDSNNEDNFVGEIRGDNKALMSFVHKTRDFTIELSCKKDEKDIRPLIARARFIILALSLIGVKKEDITFDLNCENVNVKRDIIKYLDKALGKAHQGAIDRNKDIPQGTYPAPGEKDIEYITETELLQRHPTGEGAINQDQKSEIRPQIGHPQDLSRPALVLSHEVETLQENLQEKERLLAEAKADLENIRTELETTTIRKEGLEEELTSAKSDLEQGQANYESLSKRHEELEAQLNEQALQLAGKESELTTLHQEVEDAKADLENIRAELERTTIIKEGLEEALKSAKSELEQGQTNYKSLTKRHEELEAQLNEQVLQLAGKESELKRLSDENKTAKEKETGLQLQINAISEEKDKQQHQLKGLQDQKRSLEDKLQKANRLIADEQKLNEDLSTQKQTISQENGSLTSQLNAEKTQSSQLKDELDNLRGTNQGIETQLVMTKNELEAARTELETTKTKNEQLESELASARSEVPQQQLSHVDEKLSELNGQIQRTEVEKLLSRISELENQLKQTEVDNARLEETLWKEQEKLLNADNETIQILPQDEQDRRQAGDHRLSLSAVTLDSTLTNPLQKPNILNKYPITVFTIGTGILGPGVVALVGYKVGAEAILSAFELGSILTGGTSAAGSAAVGAIVGASLSLGLILVVTAVAAGYLYYKSRSAKSISIEHRDGDDPSLAGNNLNLVRNPSQDHHHHTLANSRHSTFNSKNSDKVHRSPVNSSEVRPLMFKK